MGFWDTIADLAESVAPWSVAEAEAPAAEDSKAEEAPAEDSKDESKEESSSEDKSEDAEEEPEAEEEEEEEEEEEDDEPKDPKEELEEGERWMPTPDIARQIADDQCKESKQCAPAKHHYDECVERVTSQEADGGAKEDCVEEFFHLAHCATACAAPKVWSKLR
ncbi:Cytochrome b-c1 complex subunit 6, mitochondrial [Diaporthe eres]|uniref:Cytochrome b-c1 complex subunit 6, mitochondrial n=1 Tax=Diaporthe eres TaxID=83184 RepID=A0ABR1PIB2_DIAER